MVRNITAKLFFFISSNLYVTSMLFTDIAEGIRDGKFPTDKSGKVSFFLKKKANEINIFEAQ